MLLVFSFFSLLNFDCFRGDCPRGFFSLIIEFCEMKRCELELLSLFKARKILTSLFRCILWELLGGLWLWDWSFMRVRSEKSMNDTSSLSIFFFSKKWSNASIEGVLVKI